MHAINTSSIKSPISWQANLQPSKLFALAYWATLLIALLALWQCPVSIGSRLLLIGITAIGGFINFRSITPIKKISVQEDDIWQLHGSHSIVNGQLASGSYRSQLLIVLAIKPDNAPTKHAVIWRDSVPPEAYSYLHIRLAMTSAQQLC